MANLTAQANIAERRLVLLIGIGLLLTTYGLYVEIKHDHNPSYVALCDITPTVSCSAALNSKYGTGFGVLPNALSFRNPIYGLMFYPLMLVMVGIGRKELYGKLLAGLSVIPNLFTLFLGYILFVVLKAFCVVCVTLYLVNFGIGVYAFKRYQIITQITQIEESKRRE